MDIKRGRATMRIITDKEWDRLMDVIQENDKISHWVKMFSWVNDTGNRYQLPASYRAVRGYSSARYWSIYDATSQSVNVGFRPVVELSADALPPDTQDGDMVVIGTLYMDGKPVRVPKRPTWDGDIAHYIPDAKLEMRPALEDPAYQVTGIFVGSGIFAADRNLLKNISCADIEAVLFDKKASKLHNLLRELTGGHCCEQCANRDACKDCCETTLCTAFVPKRAYVRAITDALR